MKFSRQQQEVEVFGPPLVEIQGALYAKPEGGGRAIWCLPEQIDGASLLMLWLAFSKEVVARLKENSPARRVIEELVSKFEKLFAEAIANQN